MSPLTAKLKCPHGTGEDTHGAEAVTEVALMKMVEVGKIALKEAGEKIGVSYRQAKRIGRAIQDRGNQVIEVFVLSKATKGIAIVAIIADHLFSLIRDMRCYGRKPFEGTKDLFFFAVFGFIHHLEILGKIGHSLLGEGVNGRVRGDTIPLRRVMW
jgi:hypothetical protein